MENKIIKQKAITFFIDKDEDDKIIKTFFASDRPLPNKEEIELIEKELNKLNVGNMEKKYEN